MRGLSRRQPSIPIDLLSVRSTEDARNFRNLEKCRRNPTNLRTGLKRAVPLNVFVVLLGLSLGVAADLCKLNFMERTTSGRSLKLTGLFSHGRSGRLRFAYAAALIVSVLLIGGTLGWVMRSARIQRSAVGRDREGGR